MRVFLGGTCNNSSWRATLKKLLKIDYFDPVVDDWNEEAQQKEIKEREECDFCLYVITPAMKGVYSIAEAVDDSNKRPSKTIFCFLEKEANFTFPSLQILTFDKGEIKSLAAVGKMVERNGGKFYTSLEDVADYLNSWSVE